MIAVKKKPLNLKVGDWVKWSSSANGSWKTKVGQVVSVVPARASQYFAPARHELLPNGYIPVSASSFQRRDHDSYIVAVHQGGKRKAKLYWPVANKLSQTTKPKEKNA